MLCLIGGFCKELNLIDDARESKTVLFNSGKWINGPVHKPLYPRLHATSKCWRLSNLTGDCQRKLNFIDG